GILLRELALFYDARVAVEADTFALPAPLALQYPDFALWQRCWLEGRWLEDPEKAGGGLSEQLDYWRDQLTGVPVLDLPLDRPRPAVRSLRGARHRFAVPAGVASALEAWTRSSGLTLYMVLLTAFDALLGRWSGQRDVAVGSPVAGRTRAEVEDLIGFFVNTLVVRTDLAPGEASDPGSPLRVADLAARVRRVSLEAFAHQDLPFERLVEELAPRRDLAHTPLFQVLFALQNAPMAPPALAGLDTGWATGGEAHAVARFDLSLTLWRGPLEQQDGGLTALVEYAAELFDATTVARLAGQYLRVLEAMAEDPGAAVASLPLLGRAEEHQLRVEWNDTASRYLALGDGDLWRLVTGVAAERPDAVALETVTREGEAKRVWTYAGLETAATALGHRLRRAGVGPEVAVGVLFERSPEAVIALLATVAAGGVYVPFDPAYPPERLALLVEDAKPALVLTMGGLDERLPAGPYTVWSLGEDDFRAADGEIAAELPAVDPEHLAYVMYTSGSTGRPKGVEV
ncbi:MAG: AMP-binding protein, partial [Acidobacteria bacterium]|nr:AMP-binding protein [Acidobacteriota bacterium]